MTVIMSGLLEQGLEPDQLHARLPDYVPTTLRNSILQSFKELTLQLVLFPHSTPNPSSFPNHCSHSDLLNPTSGSAVQGLGELSAPLEMGLGIASLSSGMGPAGLSMAPAGLSMAPLQAG